MSEQHALKEAGEAAAAKVAEQQVAMEDMEQTLRQLRAELEIKALEADLADGPADGPAEGAAEGAAEPPEGVERVQVQVDEGLSEGLKAQVRQVKA